VVSVFLKADLDLVFCGYNSSLASGRGR
jgi:hypothetical protein